MKDVLLLKDLDWLIDIISLILSSEKILKFPIEWDLQLFSRFSSALLQNFLIITKLSHERGSSQYLQCMNLRYSYRFVPPNYDQILISYIFALFMNKFCHVKVETSNVHFVKTTHCIRLLKFKCYVFTSFDKTSFIFINLANCKAFCFQQNLLKTSFKVPN